MERAARLPHDPELFEHTAFLARLARGLVGDEHLAEDVLQEAWARACERPPRSAAALRGWLATTVRRLALNARRGEARRREREERSARPEALEPHDVALGRLENLREVFDLVLELPEPQRTILFLRYYEDLGPAAIAARLGIPVQTAKNRLTRSLAELRERLDRRHGGERAAWAALLVPIAYPRGVPLAIGPAASAGILGGLFVTKKALVALGTVVVGLVLWRAARPDDEIARETAQASGPAQSAELSDEPAAEGALADEPLVPEPRAPEPPSGPPMTGTLVVKLVAAGGQPAVDLGVDVRNAETLYPRQELRRAWTDAQGRARFAELAPGEVWLTVDLGYSFEGEVVAGEERELALELPAGYTVEGIVVDPAGAPLAGAEVWTSDAFDWPSERPLAHARSDGTFRLEGLASDAHIGARARGFRPSPFFQPTILPVGPSGARTVTLEVEAGGGSVAGHVLDPDGRPLTRALVTCGDQGGYIVDLEAGLRGEAAERACAATGANGSFTLPNDVPPGVRELFAIAPGFPVWSGSVEVVEGETAQVEILLARPARVRGRVLDARRQPVSGATIRSGEEVQGGWFHDDFPPSRARSDERGEFLLECLAPGPQILYAEALSARLGRANVGVTCQEGAETRCELVLDPGLVITGRVVDREGNALVGWVVDDRPIPYGTSYPRQDKTDAEGRFLIANVGDCPHELHVRAPDEWTEPRAKATAAPGEEKLIVVERTELPSGFVTGRLLLADGQAPQDVELVIRAEGSAEGYFVEFDRRDGSFEHGPLLAGPKRISVLRGGRTLAETEPFEVLAGAKVDVGTVTIRELGSVELVVNGFPAEAALGLRPVLNREGHQSELFRLVEGALRVLDVAAGTWTLTFGEREIFVPPTKVEVVSGELARVEARPVVADRLAMQLVFPEGASWGRIELHLLDDAETELGGATLAPFELDERSLRFGLPPGGVSVRARTDTGLEASGWITMDGDRRTAETLELRLE